MLTVEGRPVINMRILRPALSLRWIAFVAVVKSIGLLALDPSLENHSSVVPHAIQNLGSTTACPALRSGLLSAQELAVAHDKAHSVAVLVHASDHPHSMLFWRQIVVGLDRHLPTASLGWKVYFSVDRREPPLTLWAGLSQPRPTLIRRGTNPMNSTWTEAMLSDLAAISEARAFA